VLRPRFFSCRWLRRCSFPPPPFSFFSNARQFARFALTERTDKTEFLPLPSFFFSAPGKIHLSLFLLPFSFSFFFLFLFLPHHLAQMMRARILGKFLFIRFLSSFFLPNTLSRRPFPFFPLFPHLQGFRSRLLNQQDYQHYSFAALPVAVRTSFSFFFFFLCRTRVVENRVSGTKMPPPPPPFSLQAIPPAEADTYVFPPLLPSSSLLTSPALTNLTTRQDRRFLFLCRISPAPPLLFSSPVQRRRCARISTRLSICPLPFFPFLFLQDFASLFFFFLSFPPSTE